MDIDLSRGNNELQRRRWFGARPGVGRNGAATQIGNERSEVSDRLMIACRNFRIVLAGVIARRKIGHVTNPKFERSSRILRWARTTNPGQNKNYGTGK